MIRPTNKLLTPAPETTPARAVEVTTSNKVGAHSIQWRAPNETERPMRTCNSVMDATIKRQVCLTVKTNQTLTADAGLLAFA